MKVIIIDDEKKSRELLHNLLAEYCDDVEVLGMAGDTEHALELIQANKPDLIFLDIELQTESGFDLLKKIKPIHFDVIFTTAYEQYALKAIKINALDYLLKPIDIDDLKESIAKYRVKSVVKDTNENIQHLLKTISDKEPRKIALSTSDGVFFVEINTIIRCEAQGAYTLFYIKNNGKILVSKNLKEYEQMLDHYGFFRVHHSHLINLSEIARYVKKDGGTVILKDNTSINISSNKKEEFLARMKL